MSQVKGEIHQKSVNKDVFLAKKGEFFDAFLSQRQFWQNKVVIEKDINDFFVYSLKNES